MKYLNINKNICCDDVIKSLFNLNNLDVKVYKKLKETCEIRADELAKELNHDRSTIYRSLQRLNNCGLCKKETKTIIKGGYYHSYRCDDLDKIKKKLDYCIEQWHKKMKKIIKNLD